LARIHGDLMLLISAAELPDLLPMGRTIALMREAFRTISRNEAATAHRQALELDTGTGLLMGAAQESRGIVAKLVSVMPGNREMGLPGSVGLLLLMDPDNGAPLAAMDGTALTAIRTAALNACAIQMLARPDASVAVLIGCGTQAKAQLAGLQSCCRIAEIRVAGRSPDRARAFVEANQEGSAMQLNPVSDLAVDLKAADVVVSATNSKTPVIPGANIPPGCHVSGIGSFKPDMHEFDLYLLQKASIFVESRQTASSEAGELMRAVEQKSTHPSRWSEIGEVLDAKRPGRQNADEITFFKSVGHAVFDLVAARAAWETALESGAGMEWQP
jgi:ornithine cyclodeaminase